MSRIVEAPESRNFPAATYHFAYWFLRAHTVAQPVKNNVFATKVK